MAESASGGERETVNPLRCPCPGHPLSRRRLGTTRWTPRVLAAFDRHCGRGPVPEISGNHGAVMGSSRKLGRITPCQSCEVMSA
ncbi:hypothetical protein GCM10009799_42990 [Nocardiopsis rhodophaea]|uniref:Uncharacterized protein n=1 Tax=Nocardiopsis rhodophaea TaxID=280238 RepID=A0ABN2THY4_9ACTN